MKKLSALFIISLFLFNLFGYRLFVQYMQHQADTQLEASLDHQLYDDSQLIELKIPINLPYQTTWAEYQRYDGEIEVKGNLYKYVKRKVANDTLYVMCIPNTKKMHLESAKDNFFKLSNDLAQNNSSKKSGNSKTISLNQQNEYDAYSFFVHTFSRLAGDSKCWHGLKFQQPLSAPRISPEQPPDIIA